ncbi:GNAT family N-acetyltransferase [Salmonella enterica]|nr:GNAT family N-acetyltransferase [Salmonella enterica]EDP9076728.1 GNAT family N-acetyltransferase [Salmonella enterica subsp. arizonae]EAU5528321.1 GNAT family N-acetyltransferase [Salmonella enterica]EAX9063649.1 GNAT family N-acetyltransferase [Salmonella enterica]EAZ0145437.1 GNAT family N-acetyltransferase [Salmonella enterica]
MELIKHKKWCRNMASYKIHNINNFSKEKFIDLVKENENQFIPPLSQRVELDNYLNKILTSAENYILFDDSLHTIASAVSCYANNGKYGFITMVLTDSRFRGKGYAVTLLKHVIADVFSRGYSEINLEVHKENNRAIKLYKGLGFGFNSCNITDYRIMTLVAHSD